MSDDPVLKPMMIPVEEEEGKNPFLSRAYWTTLILYVLPFFWPKLHTFLTSLTQDQQLQVVGTTWFILSVINRSITKTKIAWYKLLPKGLK